MSIRLMTDILDGGALDLTLAQRFLLVILADFADEDGTCYPKVSTLAKRLNVKDRQTQKHLATLQQKGYIKIVQKSKGHSSNVYRIRGVRKDTCRKGHLSKRTPVREDTPRPVREDTPPILYKEPSIEPSNILSEFETFWELILRKQDKQRAIQAWKQMRKRKDNQNSPEQLAELYNQHYNSASEPRYSKMPSTWLNAGSYLDETTATQQQPSKPQSLPEPEGWREAALKYPQDVQQRIGDTWENVPEELKGYLIEDITKLQTQG